MLPNFVFHRSNYDIKNLIKLISEGVKTSYSFHVPKEGGRPLKTPTVLFDVL